MPGQPPWKSPAHRRTSGSSVNNQGLGVKSLSGNYLCEDTPCSPVRVSLLIDECMRAKQVEYSLAPVCVSADLGSDSPRQLTSANSSLTVRDVVVVST